MSDLAAISAGSQRQACTTSACAVALGPQCEPSSSPWDRNQPDLRPPRPRRVLRPPEVLTKPTRVESNAGNPPDVRSPLRRVRSAWTAARCAHEGGNHGRLSGVYEDATTVIGALTSSSEGSAFKVVTARIRDGSPGCCQDGGNRSHGATSRCTMTVFRSRRPLLIEQEPLGKVSLATSQPAEPVEASVGLSHWTSARRYVAAVCGQRLLEGDRTKRSTFPSVSFATS